MDMNIPGSDTVDCMLLVVGFVPNCDGVGSSESRKIPPNDSSKNERKIIISNIITTSGIHSRNGGKAHAWVERSKITW